MKLLSEILYKAGITEIFGSTKLAITSVCFDSRKVENSSLFVAVKGTAVDGHEYIEKAIDSGAITIVCENLPTKLNDKVTFVQVKDSSKALATIAANFYDNPSEKIKLVGVTGTNGKTTTVSLLFSLFKGMGKKVGMLSTVRNQIINEKIDSTHTTGDSVQINALLRKMVDSGCTHCFMEVSSHAVDQNRVFGLKFDIAVFSNITHDHLDYHGDFNGYIKAKKKFFDDLPDSAYALVNADDRHGETMVMSTSAKVKTYGLKTMADYKCRVLENQFSGLLLNIDNNEVWSTLVGRFNAYNLLVVYAVANLLDEDKIPVLTSISSLTSVEGRFQYVKGGNVVGIIDYAHTPDALENVLATINEIRTGNENVITVVGCGGDRDAEKRPIMAKIGAEMSDKLILTADNPRSEDPVEIIAQMRKGVPPEQSRKVLAITDRAEAIKTACSFAQEGDIILVAGKGHEKYQDVKGVKHPFDDLELLKENLQMTTK